jgi:hypothetical protein
MINRREVQIITAHKNFMLTTYIHSTIGASIRLVDAENHCCKYPPMKNPMLNKTE